MQYLQTYKVTRIVFCRKDDESLKYKLLPILVKALLSLPHGNAACERGFSVNGQILNNNRNHLCLKNINGLRSIKSHLEEIESNIYRYISQELFSSVKKNHAKKQCSFGRRICC